MRISAVHMCQAHLHAADGGACTCVGVVHVHGEGGMEARDVRPQQGGLAMGQTYLPQDVCAMRCGELCVV